MPKFCRYTSEAGKKCNGFAMNNGFCFRHGGLNTRESHLRKSGIGISQEIYINKEIAKLKSGMRLRGDKFLSKIKMLENDPDILKLKKDAVIVSAIMETLSQQLDAGEYSKEEKLMAYEALARIGNLSATIKERFHKMQSGYFDIGAMRLVVSQIITVLKNLLEKQETYQISKGDTIDIKTVIDWTRQAILDIQNSKVPMIQSGNI